jgi:hypothetical protein
MIIAVMNSSNWSHPVLFPETLFHCAGTSQGDLSNGQAQSHSADDRAAWMLEIPAF